jgi:hypothetical protein
MAAGIKATARTGDDRSEPRAATTTTTQMIRSVATGAVSPTVPATRASPSRYPSAPPVDCSRSLLVSSQAIALVFIGVATAFAMFLAIEIAWVPLRRAGAGRGWLILAALSIALVPVAAIAGWYVGERGRAVVAALGLASLVAGVIGNLGRSRGSATGPDDQTIAAAHAAGQRLEVGDAEGALDDLLIARRTATPRTAAYVDLWIRYANEELRRREGLRLSSRPTQEAIASQYRALSAQRGRPALPVVAPVIAIGVAVAVGVPIARGALSPVATACDQAEPILAAAEAAPRAAHVYDPALSHLTVDDPGVPARLMVDTGMGLAAAAASRHDPQADEKLTADGFEAGYQREWRTPDGRTLSAEVFRFGTPAGAARFHREMTEYACRFSTLAFTGTGGETGLQVNYSTGDPVVEQLAWVDGPYRIVVSRSYAERPFDHAEIIDLAFRAMKQLAGL